MKYLFNFDTLTEYNNVKDTLEKPYVVTIDENNGLKYNTDVIRVPEGSCGNVVEKTVFDCSNQEELEKLFNKLNSLLQERGEYSEISDCGIVVLNPLLNKVSALINVVERRNDIYGIAIDFKCYDASSWNDDPYGMSYGVQYYTADSIPEWRIYNASIG